jgi:Ca2+-binding RTX toxin-like protein
MSAKRRVLVAVIAALVWPANCYAGIASVSDSAVSFVASSGETNDLVVRRTATGMVMVDSGASIAPGPGCESVTAAEVFCPLPAQSPGLDVRLGDMDDVATYTHLSTWQYIHTPAPGNTLAGGDGNDTLDGGSNAWVRGEAGNDMLQSGHLDGGPGNDMLQSGHLDGGSGADTFGGPGYDRVSYGDRVNPVTVSTDGLANDGESGEGDQVAASVEIIVGGDGGDMLAGDADLDGGPGNDLLTAGVDAGGLAGGDGNDTLRAGTGREDGLGLSGGRGDDLLIGSPLPDELSGGQGADRLMGRAGADELYDGGGADLVHGGRGRDVVFGGAGRDRFFGDRGKDRLVTCGDYRRDLVDGGAGRDRAIVDRLELIRRVEIIRRWPPWCALGPSDRQARPPLWWRARTR